MTNLSRCASIDLDSTGPKNRGYAVDDNAMSELLVQKGLLDEKQVKKARELMESMGEKGILGKIAVRLGYLTEAQLRELEKSVKEKTIDLDNASLDLDALTVMPEDFLRNNSIIPLKSDKTNTIQLAMTSETDLQVIESVQFMTNSLVDPVVVPKEKIVEKLDTMFSVSSSKKMKGLDIAIGEENVLDEPPIVLAKALAQVLIEKGVVSRAELFNKTRQLKGKKQ